MDYSVDGYSYEFSDKSIIGWIVNGTGHASMHYLFF